MELHPRNKHKGTYDFVELTFKLPELKQYVRPNKYGNDSIDFSNPSAVKTLNKALLKPYYKIDFWDIPDGFLVPPIPGRGDYIHNIADLLKERTGEDVKWGVGSTRRCAAVRAWCVGGVAKEYASDDATVVRFIGDATGEQVCQGVPSRRA